MESACAIALAYAKEGAKVVLTARTAVELDEIAGQIRKRGGTAPVLPADLSDRAVARQIVVDIEAAVGSIEILVNNAGIGSSSKPLPVVDFDDDFWDKTLAVNLTTLSPARSENGPSSGIGCLSSCGVPL